MVTKGSFMGLFAGLFLLFAPVGVALSDSLLSGIVLLVYALGVAVSVIWPYYVAYKEDGVPFDWSYVRYRIIAGLVGAVPSMLLSTKLNELIALTGQYVFWVALVIVFFFGMGVSDSGRTAQKHRNGS